MIPPVMALTRRDQPLCRIINKSSAKILTITEEKWIFGWEQYHIIPQCLKVGIGK
jgi:hypothetical protein